MVEETKENRNALAATTQQLSAKLHLSSVSSLRTFVDQTRGASPPDQNQAYPASGLYSNLAFSNFYSSTEESDIEAALQTARQYHAERSSLASTRHMNIDGESSRRQLSESEEEAPISGLNHLGEYLASMHRATDSSALTSQRLELEAPCDEGLAKLDSATSPLG